jgi:hypothetical protein
LTLTRYFSAINNQTNNQMDYADRVRKMLEQYAAQDAAISSARAKGLTSDVRESPDTNYLEDPREREFDPETEIKYQMRDKLGYVKGGQVSGTPPNPKKDNKLVPMQSGEYVIPTPVVKAVGKDFFDSLVKSVTGKNPSGSPEQGFQEGGGWSEPKALSQIEDFPGDYYPADWMPAEKGPKQPFTGWFGGTDESPQFSWSPYFNTHNWKASNFADWNFSDWGGDGVNYPSKKIPGGIQIGGVGDDYYDNLHAFLNAYKEGRGGHGGGVRSAPIENFGNLPMGRLGDRPRGYPQGKLGFWGQNPGDNPEFVGWNQPEGFGPLTAGPSEPGWIGGTPYGDSPSNQPGWRGGGPLPGSFSGLGSGPGGSLEGWRGASAFGPRNSSDLPGIYNWGFGNTTLRRPSYRQFAQGWRPYLTGERRMFMSPSKAGAQPAHTGHASTG